MRKLKLNHEIVRELISLMEKSIENMHENMREMNTRDPKACFTLEWAVISIVLEVHKTLFIRMRAIETAFIMGKNPVLKINTAEAHALNTLVSYQDNHILSAQVLTQLKLV